MGEFSIFTFLFVSANDIFTFHLKIGKNVKNVYTQKKRIVKNYILTGKEEIYMPLQATIPFFDKEN